MNTRTLVALTLLTAAFVQASAQKYDLSPRFTAGNATVYDLTFRIDGMPQKTTYKSKLENEIIDVRDDGSYITSSTQTDHKLIIDGKEVDSPSEELTEVTTYDKNGVPMQMGGDMDSPESFRVAFLTSFLAPSKPVAINETWVIDIAADQEKRIRKVKHTYKLLRISKIGEIEVAEVSIKVREISEDHPASVLGKVWVDIKTGETVRYQIEVLDLPIGAEYIDGGVLIELAKPSS